jgi:hypothetical protein
MASTATLLTRRQVAALLEKPEGEIKAQEGGAFHPIKGPDGSWRYPPEEVSALLRGTVVGSGEFEPAGAVCAAAFELFQNGRKLPEVVISLKQSPALVRSLRGEYDAMAGTLTIGSGTMAFLQKTFRTAVRDEAHLVALIAGLDERLLREHERGRQAGIVEAADLGEIVDPESGVKRPLRPADLDGAAHVVAERWRRADQNAKPESSADSTFPSCGDLQAGGDVQRNPDDAGANPGAPVRSSSSAPASLLE